jgi:hypothetical protein
LETKVITIPLEQFLLMRELYRQVKAALYSSHNPKSRTFKDVRRVCLALYRYQEQSNAVVLDKLRGEKEMETKRECEFCKAPPTSIVRIGAEEFIYICGHCFDVLWKVLTYRGTID